MQKARVGNSCISLGFTSVLAAETQACMLTGLPFIFIKKVRPLLLQQACITQTVVNVDLQDAGRWRAYGEALGEICLFDMPVVVETRKTFCLLFL